MKVKALYMPLAFLIVIIVAALITTTIFTKKSIVVSKDDDDKSATSEQVQGTSPDFLIMEQATIKDESTPGTYMTPEPLWY